MPFALRTYRHDPSAAARVGYGAEAAEALGVDPARVLKTLVVRADDGWALAIAPSGRLLDFKAVADALRAKRAALAPRTDAERVSGYVIGGISPFGQRRRMPAVLDSSAAAWPTVLVSAGRRGLDVEVAPDDLARLTGAVLAAISRD